MGIMRTDGRTGCVVARDRRGLENKTRTSRTRWWRLAAQRPVHPAAHHAGAVDRVHGGLGHCVAGARVPQAPHRRHVGRPALGVCMHHRQHVRRVAYPVARPRHGWKRGSEDGTGGRGGFGAAASGAWQPAPPAARTLRSPAASPRRHPAACRLHPPHTTSPYHPGMKKPFLSMNIYKKESTH